MSNFASLSCFYSKLRWGAFLPPPPPVQNRVKAAKDDRQKASFEVS